MKLHMEVPEFEEPGSRSHVQNPGADFNGMLTTASNTFKSRSGNQIGIAGDLAASSTN